MMPSRGVWRRHGAWWLPALAFFLLNLGLLSAYRLVYAGQAQLRSQRLARSGARLKSLVERRKELEELVRRAQENRRGIETFRRERLSTQSERLTQVIAEVKELARRADLAPSTLNYPEDELAQYGLLEREVAFSVNGTYPSLRRFLNFLELSEQFVTLKEVRLSGGDRQGPDLRITLRVATLFEHSAPARGAASSGGAGP